jgi:hypothetical protein
MMNGLNACPLGDEWGRQDAKLPVFAENDGSQTFSFRLFPFEFGILPTFRTRFFIKKNNY